MASKLIIVDIALSRDQDNPQLIFESMNSTGRELSQADDEQRSAARNNGQKVGETQ
jgi:uncharacterized protein with ParB-like and HNH nuclease domain